jgi:hypothetical protein
MIWDEWRSLLLEEVEGFEEEYLPEWTGIRKIPAQMRRVEKNPSSGRKRELNKVCDFEEKYFRDRVSASNCC